MVQKYIKIFFTLSVCTFPLGAMHNNSRYFSFFERPNARQFPKAFTFTPAVFVTSASRAGNDRLNQNIPISRLWGEYDLNTLFSNMQLYKTALDESYTNPFVETGHPEWEGKSIVYDIRGRVLSRGFSLACEQRINKLFSFGAYFPFMEIISHHRFELARPTQLTGNTLSDAELADLDSIRRSLQEQSDLNAPDFSRWVVGDLDLFVRARKRWDHRLLMRSIFMNVRAGCIFPTGTMRDTSNPASLAAMSDGHFGVYFEVNPEFELKQNLFLGTLFGVQAEFPETVEERIPITPLLSDEAIGQNRDLPFFYSPATGSIRRERGVTLKLAPYITFANIVDGLNLHFRWDFINHLKDNYEDHRSFTEQALLPSNFSAMKRFSFFTVSEGTFEFEYDSKRALKKWALQPSFIISYSMPLGSQDNAVQQHQFSLGVDLHF